MNASRLLSGLSALACLSLGLWRGAAADARYEASWDSLDKRPVPAWYLDAKFGIFIHWGVYAVPAWGAPKTYSEWYWNNMSDKKAGNPWWEFHKKQYGENFAYQDFAPMFKAELYDAKKWADIFYRSGAKYVVPTSKHHDGFALWPSADADRTWGRAWNASSAGPKRDLLGELAEAVRAKEGMYFGFYYSLYEWFNPLWLKDRKQYVTEHMHPQFKDVVTRYKPAIIFGDGEWDMPSSDWKSPELLAWLFNESPCRDVVVVDDRWGGETRHKHGTYFTTEYGAGMADDSHPWEENRGMGYSYGYNRAETADDYKSSRELVLVLADLVSRGGNFLLDIGPSSDGRIPAVMEDRLLEIGAWLRVNGEAIYGTRHAGRDCQWSEGKRSQQGYKEFKEEYNLMDQVGFEPRKGRAVKQAFFTRKPDALYAISPGWPGGTYELRNIKLPAGAKVTLLGYADPIAYSMEGTTVKLSLPNLRADQLPCQHAFTFKLPGGVLLPEK